MVARRESEQKPGLQPRHVVVAIFGVLLLVFAILNFERVDVDFGFGTVRGPLVVVIALSAALGFVIGWLVGRRRN